jgi:hypothetical protein
MCWLALELGDSKGKEADKYPTNKNKNFSRFSDQIYLWLVRKGCKSLFQLMCYSADFSRTTHHPSRVV